MTDSDQELVRRCQQASGAAFEAAYRELYDLYSSRIYTICLRVTGNEEDALDAAQETLVTLARRIRDFAFRSRFSSWVFRIAVNAAIDVRRRRLAGQRGSVRTVLASGEADPLADAAADPDRSDPLLDLEGRESVEMVRRALASINPRFSSLLALRYMEGLSYEEIAEVLECSLGTVKSRLNRAHAALREHLARRGEGPPAGG
ncbi:MAG: sigma-70 family RNA polymerase sigma factor [Planctomycetota bacterium]|nr:MAG: sigma-70 family RNA polymerase sigma factor [Planctomycetota bacterium]